jgi:hypothetical protein
VLNGHRITCPFHGACFDVRTGDIEDGPSVDHLCTLTTDVRDEGVFVALPTDGAAKVSHRFRPAIPVTAASATSSPHVVVVGAGAAGLTTVEELRRLGFGGRITVISACRGRGGRAVGGGGGGGGA